MVEKEEVILRVCAVLVLFLAASLVAFDTQTKLLYYSYQRKATYKDLHSLSLLVRVDYAAAVYNLLQLGRCFYNTRFVKGSSMRSYLLVLWLNFLLDQITAYMVFSATTASLQASILALTGSKALQWMKICNRYTRFCYQIGGSLLCGFTAFLIMFGLSAISAFNLFRHYSPKRFLLLLSDI